MSFSQKDKSTYVRQTFNEIATRYDLMNTLMSFGLDKRWRKRAVKEAKVHRGHNVLDVCCGTGQLSMALAEQVGDDGKVIGLDFSENMLDKAKHNLNQFPYNHRVQLMQGDAMNLPFADSIFDGVTVGWGLRNLPDLERGIKEMARVLKPGAYLVSLDMAKPELPVFKQFYWLYFEKLIPLMGKLWAGKRSAYQYLHDSAREFPSQRKLADIFEECGLTETEYFNLAGGVVAIVKGRKPITAQE